MTSLARRPADRPLLVLVSGVPGSGKTTLARALAQRLGLPLLAKDAIKERLMDVLGTTEPARSRQIGRATFEVLYAVTGALLDAGVGLVLEANFVRGYGEAPLAPLVAQARAVQVHCHVPAGLARQRYADRAARGERHPGHFDALTLDRWPIVDGPPAPLALDTPTLVIDTSDGYAPPLDDIVRFALTGRNVPPRLDWHS